MGHEPANRDDSTPAGTRHADESVGPAVDRPEEPTVCANCTAPIDTSEWHPITTATDDDRFRVYAFCGSDCREAWVDEH
jgi:hypothetical protein